MPGTWVERAQSALDELGQMRTIAEVEERFGTARALAEEILGFPVAGGCATKPVVRATGRALQHRLGPAVAAEALSWAASVIGVVDTSTIEALMEAAADAQVACRPIDLADRYQLHDRLGRIRHLPSRRRKLLELWADLPTRLAWRPEPSGGGSSHDFWGFGPFDSYLLDPHTAMHSHFPLHTGDIVRTYSDATPAEQVELFKRVQPGVMELLAASEALFDLAKPIVATCLLHATAIVLTNKACPPELRTRVRYPYDAATLELALRAGPWHFDIARMRRRLEMLDPDERSHLMAKIPFQLLLGLRCCGLIRAEDFISGDLASLDLADRRIAMSAFGRLFDWPGSSIPAVLVETLLRHPQAGSLTWMLDSAPTGRVPGEIARTLIDNAGRVVAAAAIRHLPPEALESRDADLAAQCGDFWTARCPSVPAALRPERTPDLDDDYAALGWNAPFSYPQAVAALDGATFPEAPGWTVSVPRAPREVRRNARLMRNCTGRFTYDITEGFWYLMIVHDPQGHRFNVGIDREGHRFTVGQINSWGNGGIEPSWIRPALRAWFRDARWREPLSVEAARPVRRPSDRRDRRRARASAARRRKR